MASSNPHASAPEHAAAAGDAPLAGSSFLNVRAFTWNRDSHGLFDYESQSVTKKTFRVKTDARLFRVGNEVKLTDNHYPRDDSVEGDHLVSVNSKAGREEYEVKGKQFQENGVVRNDEIWLVVRSLKNAEGKINYKLAKNDIIKLGRVKFRIKDLFIPGIDGESRVMDVPFEEIIISKDFEMKEGYHCRFCWMDEQNDDNPLISACKCAGTMGLVHLECLKAWQTTKMQTKRTDNLISLYWKTFECEICKTPYPFKVRHKDNTFRLVDVEVPPSQCRLVLESLIFDKNSSRMIHVMTPSSTKRVYKMGRGHDSDVRVSDISVSRFHARISFEGDHFVLEDNVSKFGTLVLVNDQLPIESGSSKAVQIGRTVVSFSIKSNSPTHAQRHQSHLFMHSPDERGRHEVPAPGTFDAAVPPPAQNYAAMANMMMPDQFASPSMESYDPATQAQILQLCNQILMQQKHLQENLRNLQHISGIQTGGGLPPAAGLPGAPAAPYAQPPMRLSQPGGPGPQPSGAPMPPAAGIADLSQNQQILQLIQQNSALQILSQLNQQAAASPFAAANFPMPGMGAPPFPDMAMGGAAAYPGSVPMAGPVRRGTGHESQGMNPRMRQMQPGPRNYRAPAEDEVGSEEDEGFNLAGMGDDEELDDDEDPR